MLPRWIACFLAFAVLVAAASAQVYPWTLEYLTDSSDIVVRGRVASIDGLAVDLSVKEVLKGTAPDKVRVLVADTAPNRKLLESKLADWDSTWFLVRGEDGLYRVDDLDNRTYGLTFAQRGRRLIDFNLHPVYIEETALKEIRAEAILKPERNDKALVLPAPTWYGPSTGTPGGMITMPLDERIVPLARKWVQPLLSDPWQRLLGVQALAGFKSERNIAIMKAIALDTGSIESAIGVADYKAEAQKVLTAWGVPVPAPSKPDLLVPSSVSKAAVRVEIDGKEVSFKGVSPPRIIAGRAYARACTISAPLGVTMGTYHLDGRTGVMLQGKGLTLDMPADSHHLWTGDGVEDLELPARLIKGEGFFPIRFVAERLGATVKWDAARRMVVIKTAGANP